MSNEVNINGVSYILESDNDRVHLQRYNEKYKSTVNLYFPNGSENNKDVIKILSDLYIERNKFK